VGTKANDVFSSETRREIVAAVFPELRHGDDPVLERYLELRKQGKVVAALALYNGALRAMYPEDSSRIRLISLRRENNPAWRTYQARLLDELAAGIARRVEANADTLLDTFRPGSLGNAWAALGAVDGLLRRLSCVDAPDRALAVVDRHLLLVRIVECNNKNSSRVRGLERATDLLREYVALSTLEKPGEQDFVARSLALEERRRLTGGPSSRVQSWHEDGQDFVALSRAREEARKAGERNRARFFDLERLRFSARERDLVELRNPPPRHEDLVLAWCHKYWRLAIESGFERTVFLYSRKFGTRHFDIFREIRLGRLRGREDDEILTALSSLLSTGYSYSVTGDLYMQRRWKLLKASLFDEIPVAAPATKVQVPSGSMPPAVSSRRAAPAQIPVRAPNPGPANRRVTRQARTPVANKPRITIAKATSLSAPYTTGPGKTFFPGTSSRAPQGTAVKQRLAPRLTSQPLAIETVDHRSGGSISDRIRRLSGRQYDVYRNIFLDRLRDDIRRRLLAVRSRPAGIFDTGANEAEDIIFAFMSARYEDPFMDWEASPERRLVERLGFPMPTLDGIIEDRWRKIS
jgi:hypothetical protein